MSRRLRPILATLARAQAATSHPVVASRWRATQGGTPWTLLPQRRVVRVIAGPDQAGVVLECGHWWETRRRIAHGQRVRCVQCGSVATRPAP